MSTFGGRKRKGCASCGKFVMDLDHATAEMRHAAARHGKIPTQRNKTLAEQAAERLREARRFYNEHMEQHASKEQHAIKTEDE